MNSIQQLFDDNKETIKRLHESILESSFPTIRNIYADLNCLKDTRLGLMISLCTKDRLNYIKAGIERYNRRPVRKFTFAYPEFPYTEEQLQQMYNRPKYWRQAFDYAPDTDLACTLHKLHTTICQINARTEYTGTINLIINCYPFKIGPLLNAYLAVLQEIHRDSRFKFKLVSIPHKDITLKQWSSWEYMFIDDIAKLIPLPTWQQICVTTAIQNNYVFAAPTLSEEHFQEWNKTLDWNDEEAIRLRFSLTEQLLNITTNFKFIRFDIPYTEPKE